ncbi:MAG TPA: OsmC family protein [Acidimicrobiia bacterium]|nr:OsmC family protein [Acidimicrobiia bacterium]
MKVEVEQVAGRRMVVRARGVELIVDDTLAAGGPGDGFRPTELLMGALGTCMIGTMINFARNQDISVSNISMTLEDESAEHPERIGDIRAVMRLETDATDRRRAGLERVAAACKIHNTLEHGPEIGFGFEVIE